MTVLQFFSLSFHSPSKGVPRRALKGVGLALLCSLLSGCLSMGAPEFMVLDSYFPFWMLCAVIGILAAIITRLVFVRLGIDELLPVRLLVYVCVALLVACAIYLLFFMR